MCLFVPTWCFCFTSKMRTAEIISELFWTLEYRLPVSVVWALKNPPDEGKSPSLEKSYLRLCEAAQVCFPLHLKMKA